MVRTSRRVRGRHMGGRRTLHRFSGIFSRNPILVQGMLLAPAVVASYSLKNAAALSLTFVIVTLPVMLLASLKQNKLPAWLRIPTYTCLAAALLIAAYFAVAPIAPNIFDSMGMYFSLMAVNSVVLLRSERFAGKGKPLLALLDGACYSLGFALVIGVVACVRELLAYNTLWGQPISLPFKIGAVALPFMGFLFLGLLSGVGRYLRELVLHLVKYGFHWHRNKGGHPGKWNAARDDEWESLQRERELEKHPAGEVRV